MMPMAPKLAATCQGYVWALNGTCNLKRFANCGLAAGFPLRHAGWPTSHPAQPRPLGRKRAPSEFARALVLLILLLLPLPNFARPEVATVPFRTAQTFILVQAKVNGNPATLLLDTGANRTIVSIKIYGTAQFTLQRMRQNSNGPGHVGESVRLTADVALANRVWVGQPVSVMNLEDLKQELGVNFDGLLGEDLLREFRSVRINYKTRVIELEQ